MRLSCTVSQVLSFLSLLLLLFLLDRSLSSEHGFAQVKTWMSSFVVKFIVWGMLSALIYHIVAGVRHLIMDLGYGETLETGRLGAKLVLIIAVILIIIAGVWIVW